MKARQLRRIMSLSIPKRLDAIAEGIELLVEHVSTLTADIAFLREGGRARSSASIGIQADEEAAKVLILLDLVRMGWRDQAACTKQVDRFYDHLARGIYANVAGMLPATIKELRRIVDSDRQSHYLDGPNDVDWIFRNTIKTRREDQLYVDYVSLESGDEWVTPALRDDLFPAWGLGAPPLVLSLSNAGVTSRLGLDIVSRHWRTARIDDSIEWHEVARRTRLILDELYASGLVSNNFSDQDLHRVREQWTFPMSGLDLSEIQVTASELESQRDRWLAQQR